MGTKRFFFGLAVLSLAGCAATQPARDPAAPVSMQFATTPTQLYAAVPLACSGPGERVVRPSSDRIECRRLLPPEGAAGAILRYDGTIDALPESVIRFQSRSTDSTAMIIEASAFISVPQRDGREVHVIYPDPAVDRKMRQMLTRLGGTPVAP
ncbi:hypothetical protein [Lacimonas salitolerans]|uniref:Lipoprotein n=1 Tax=Lacimonas salitolerans TaxID=1323750 RepID=A0ABW4EJ73_9RHOB